MNRLAHAALCVGLGALALGACGTVDTQPMRICAWGRGASAGRCPSLCAWQCDAVADAPCAPEACVERCVLDRQPWSDHCFEAAYREWVCLAKAHGTGATCGADGVARFAPLASCEAEHAVALGACGSGDPLALRPPGELCPWQCELAELLGCGGPGCVAACEARDAALPDECRAAARARWVCQAETGRLAARCCEDRLELPGLADACPAETADVARACGDVDPLVITLEPAADAGERWTSTCDDAGAPEDP